MAIFDGNLKQRLIGALVLIVLAVVFLPMIFNNKGEKLPETIVTVPAEPTKPYTIVNTPPSSNVVTTINEPTTPETSTKPPSTPTTSAATVNQTASTSATSNTNTVSSVSQPNAQGITASWTVQVAAVSNLQNAEAFTNKLRQANYNAYTRTTNNLHRIFVGPFIEKSEAERVKNLIEKQFKEKGIMQEFKPEKQ